MSDTDLLSTTSGMEWAERFVLRVRDNPTIATDVGTMVAWFAGAIEVGRRAGQNDQTEADHLRYAIRRMLNEFGVPNEDYPAPVANAVEIGRAAIGAEQ